MVFISKQSITFFFDNYIKDLVQGKSNIFSVLQTKQCVMGGRKGGCKPLRSKPESNDVMKLESDTGNHNSQDALEITATTGRGKGS